MKSNASYFLYTGHWIRLVLNIYRSPKTRVRLMDMHMVMPFEILNNSFIVAASSYFKAARHQHCLMMTCILPQQPKS